MVLHRGAREIDLLFLGRGHTGGDTVVYLPKEKIVATGDLMESRLAYMGDAFFDEWVTTLDALKKLDFNVDLPGHGIPVVPHGLDAPGGAAQEPGRLGRGRGEAGELDLARQGLPADSRSGSGC